MCAELPASCSNSPLKHEQAAKYRQILEDCSNVKGRGREVNLEASELIKGAENIRKMTKISETKGARTQKVSTGPCEERSTPSSSGLWKINMTG